MYEDNTFTYLRKGHIMNYYLSTFDSFEELEEELENTFGIIVSNDSEHESYIKN